jgi:hypothetical protein
LHLLQCVDALLAGGTIAGHICPPFPIMGITDKLLAQTLLGSASRFWVDIDSAAFWNHGQAKREMYKNVQTIVVFKRMIFLDRFAEPC